jgi:hypothetical protein
MEWTKKERALARQVVSDKELTEFLAKIFTKQEEDISLDIVSKKTNQELGEIVRANAMAQQKVLSRWASLVRLGTPDVTKGGPTGVPE